MGKTAFVFAGQGSQHAGMGSDLSDFSESAAVFDTIEEIRPGTRNMCLCGTESELAQTKNTQPCLFSTEMAAAVCLEAGGIHADMTAGFSLGELCALTYGGAGSISEMFSIVCKRGELMQEASEKHPAKMAAVLKLTVSDVENLCSRFEYVYPVNYNCPGQITVSARADQMPEFIDAVKEAGGRAIPLKVGGGFHSPFMNEASKAFAKFLESRNIKAPSIPVYANKTAKPYGNDVRAMLADQIISPVRWEDSIRNMIRKGADTFIEIGPGKTLSGMIGRIDKNVRTFNVETKADAEAVIAALSE